MFLIELFVSSVLQIWYVELRISQSISASPLVQSKPGADNFTVPMQREHPSPQHLLTISRYVCPFCGAPGIPNIDIRFYYY